MLGAGRFHLEHRRQQAHQLPRHRVAETYRTAHQADRRASTAVTNDFVTLAKAFPRQVEGQNRRPPFALSRLCP